MPYTPPPGGGVTLDFLGTFTPQPGGAVLVGFAAAPNTIYPTAIAPGGYGTPNVYYGQQSLFPSGIASGSVGTPVVLGPAYITGIGTAMGAVGIPSIRNNSQFVLPTGWAAGLFGTAALVNSQRLLGVSGIAPGGFGTATVVGPGYITPTGSAMGSFGTPSILFSRRSLLPTSLGVQVAFGTAEASGGIRSIDLAGRSPLTQVFGTAQVAYRIRFVYPTFISSFAAGRPSVDKTHFVAPVGLDATLWGTALVHDNRQFLGAGNNDFTLWGLPNLTRSPRVVAPVGFPSTVETYPSTRWGIASLINKRQVITQLYVPGDQDEAFGSRFYMAVANRNRTVTTFGAKSERFGISTRIENTGRAIVGVGLDAIGWGAATFIAYRIRHVTPTDAIGPEYWPTPIVLKTPQLLPVGFSNTRWGIPGVVNTRRYYNVALFNNIAWGLPFVAPRIRSVQQYWPWEGVLGTPDVQNHTRYLAPTGFIATRWSAGFVYEHFNIIAPRWNHQHDLMGDQADVRNKTPQVYPYGPPMTLWGTAEIRWNPFPLRAAGWRSQAFGGTVIDHREKHVLVPPVNANTGFGATTQVRNDTPDPPGPQPLPVSGWQSTVFGAVSIHKNGIDPVGIAPGGFGSAAVILQGALVPSIQSGALFGNTTVIGPLYMTARGIAAPDDPASGFTPTKHQVNPYTIWATFDATAQAKANHGGSWLNIDTYLESGRSIDAGVRPFFGEPTVSNYYRQLGGLGHLDSTFGLAVVTHKDRVLLPSGWKSLRMGFAKLPFPVTVGIQPMAYSYAIGAATVELQNRALQVSGFSSGDFGQSSIELFNRTLLGHGWDSFTMTGPVSGVPYGPVTSTRIHFPEPILPVGNVLTLWGDTVIDFRIRELHPLGWEEFDTDYTLGQFNDRIAVRHRGKGIVPTGIHSSWFGYPTVSINHLCPEGDH